MKPTIDTLATANDVIEARGLVKRYGDEVALDGLDLTVPEGTILGLLGPNGAGKTTAVSILTTLLEPDFGSPTLTIGRWSVGASAAEAGAGASTRLAHGSCLA